MNTGWHRRPFNEGRSKRSELRYRPQYRPRLLHVEEIQPEDQYRFAVEVCDARMFIGRENAGVKKFSIKNTKLVTYILAGRLWIRIQHSKHTRMALSGAKI